MCPPAKADLPLILRFFFPKLYRLRRRLARAAKNFFRTGKKTFLASPFLLGRFKAEKQRRRLALHKIFAIPQKIAFKDWTLLKRCAIIIFAVEA